MKYYYILLATILLVLNCNAQEGETINSFKIPPFDESYHALFLDSLRNNYSLNKEFPFDLELECLTALSYFPELKKTNIKFYFDDKLKPMMQSIPCINSLRRIKEKRVYFIKIRTGSTQDKSFSELVGVLGHELAHVLQTFKRSSFSTLCLGITWQFNKNKREHIEKEADIITIKKGLGYSLYERRKNEHLNIKSQNQFEYVNQFYLTPEEILEEIKRNMILQND